MENIIIFVLIFTILSGKNVAATEMINKNFKRHTTNTKVHNFDFDNLTISSHIVIFANKKNDPEKRRRSLNFLHDIMRVNNSLNVVSDICDSLQQESNRIRQPNEKKINFLKVSDFLFNSLSSDSEDQDLNLTSDSKVSDSETSDSKVSDSKISNSKTSDSED